MLDLRDIPIAAPPQESALVALATAVAACNNAELHAFDGPVGDPDRVGLAARRRAVGRGCRRPTAVRRSSAAVSFRPRPQADVDRGRARRRAVGRHQGRARVGASALLGDRAGRRRGEPLDEAARARIEEAVDRAMRARGSACSASRGGAGRRCGGARVRARAPSAICPSSGWRPCSTRRGLRWRPRSRGATARASGYSLSRAITA